MSASSSPTRSPCAASATARLTAVVDLPTPPLPEATATIVFTSGSSIGALAGRRLRPVRHGHARAAGGPARPAPPGFGPARLAMRGQHHGGAQHAGHRGRGAAPPPARSGSISRARSRGTRGRIAPARRARSRPCTMPGGDHVPAGRRVADRQRSACRTASTSDFAHRLKTLSIRQYRPMPGHAGRGTVRVPRGQRDMDGHRRRIQPLSGRGDRGARNAYARRNNRWRPARSMALNNGGPSPWGNPRPGGPWGSPPADPARWRRPRTRTRPRRPDPPGAGRCPPLHPARRPAAPAARAWPSWRLIVVALWAGQRLLPRAAGRAGRGAALRRLRPHRAAGPELPHALAGRDASRPRASPASTASRSASAPATPAHRSAAPCRAATCWRRA